MKNTFARIPHLVTVWLFSCLRWPASETTEWFCFRSALWWVIMLVPILHLFGSNAAFSGLARYGAEARWQAVFGALLLAQALAVCFGSAWARVAALFGFGAAWAAVSALLWVGSAHALGWVPLSTGIGPYASLSFDCYAVAIHIARCWYVDHLSRFSDHLSRRR